MSPIRTDSQLADRITALITDAPEGGISAEDVRAILDDFKDTLFHRTNVPIYQMANSAYDAATGTITGTNQGVDPELPSLVAAIIPAATDYSGLAARVRIEGVDEPLHGPTGDPVAPRQLTPNRAHMLLRGYQAYRIMDVVGERPQDFLIRSAITPQGDTDLTAAAIAAGTSSDTNLILSPDFGGAGHYLYFGSPVNGPRLIRISFGEAGRNAIHSYTDDPGIINDPDGIPYKWFRSFNVLSQVVGNSTWDLGFAPPAPPGP